MIFLKINCSYFSRLVWRRHAKFQIGTASGATALFIYIAKGMTKCWAKTEYYVVVIVDDDEDDDDDNDVLRR